MYHLSDWLEMNRSTDVQTGVTLIHGTCQSQQNDKWVSDWRGNAVLSACALGVFNPPMNSTYKGGCLSVIRGGKWGSSELSVLRPTPQSLNPPPLQLGRYSKTVLLPPLSKMHIKAKVERVLVLLRWWSCGVWLCVLRGWTRRRDRPPLQAPPPRHAPHTTVTSCCHDYQTGVVLRTTCSPSPVSRPGSFISTSSRMDRLVASGMLWACISFDAGFQMLS